MSLTGSPLDGINWREVLAVRNIGPFEKRELRSDRPAPRRWPKPDFVRTTLNARELHAYYIALISSPTLSVLRDSLKLKVQSFN